MRRARTTIVMTIAAATAMTTIPSPIPKYQPPDAPSAVISCDLLSRAYLVNTSSRGREPAAFPAVADRDELAHDRHRRFLRARAAEVQSDRCRDAFELRIAHACSHKSFAPPGLRAAAAHRADVRRLRVERRKQCGVVELRVVRQYRHVRATVDPSELRQRLRRPLGQHGLGLGKALGRGKTGARIDHE